MHIQMRLAVGVGTEGCPDEPAEAAEPERGAQIQPETNDEVLIAFAQADLRAAYVVGSLWDGKDPPPSSNAEHRSKPHPRPA